MRILLFPITIGRSHLNRLILIAQELRNQGIDIAFRFNNPNDTTLQKYNIPVFPVADTTIANFKDNTFVAFTPDLVEQCIQDELKIIEIFNPETGYLRPKILGNIALHPLQEKSFNTSKKDR